MYCMRILWIRSYMKWILLAQFFTQFTGYKSFVRFGYYSVIASRTLLTRSYIAQIVFSSSQSSQPGQPLWTDPGMRSGISVRELISTLKKCRQGMNGQISPQILTTQETPPFVLCSLSFFFFTGSRSSLSSVLCVAAGSYVALTLMGKPNSASSPGGNQPGSSPYTAKTNNIPSSRDSRITAPQPVDVSLPHLSCQQNHFLFFLFFSFFNKGMLDV